LTLLVASQLLVASHQWCVLWVSCLMAGLRVLQQQWPDLGGLCSCVFQDTLIATRTAVFPALKANWLGRLSYVHEALGFGVKSTP